MESIENVPIDDNDALRNRVKELEAENNRLLEKRDIICDFKDVIDLQRDLSFAEQIASAIIYMVSHREKGQSIGVPVLLNYSNNSDVGIFECAYETVRDIIEEYDKLKEENENLKRIVEKNEK